MKRSINNIPEGYKRNSTLGVIPNEWEVKRLGEIFEIIAGGDIELAHVKNNKDEVFKYPIYANAAKNKGLYGFSDIYKIDYDCITVSGRGDIGIANARSGKFYPIVRLLVLNPQQKIDTIYFENAINIMRIYCESTGVPQLTSPQLSKYKVLVPPLPEQRKIAEVLSTWDRAIEKQTLLVEKLELRKKGLMQQLLTGKKRLPGFSGVAWKKVKLDEVTTFLSNNSLSRDNLNTLRGSILNIHYGDVLIKLPTIVDVSLVDLPFINEELNIVSKDYVSEGDIIMADTAEDGTVGKACEVVNVGNNKVVSGLHTILIHPTIAFAPMFLGYYLNSKEYHKQILSIMQGIKVYSITKDALRKTNIKIPPLEEQNAIAEILSVCDKEITLAKQKLDTLRQQKKGLMQVLLTGKKRVEL